MAISTKPASGTRDFLAEQVLARETVIQEIRQAYELHGFVPLQTPAFERLSILLNKYGEDGDPLVFKLLRRGELPANAAENPESLTDLGLRYDLTVPLARVYAKHRNKLPKFYKRYQIQPVWRADRPQKGRFREFYQCDIDFIGSQHILAEFEVLSAATSALKALNFPSFTVHINDRKILTAILEHAAIKDEKSQRATLIIIDKLDKIGAEKVKKLLLNDLTEESVKIIDQLILTPSNDDTLSSLKKLEQIIGSANGAFAQLQELFSLIKTAKLHGNFRFDPSLARGLSYYTGPIFEFSSPNLNGSIGGGGRYDNLIGSFSSQPVPSVGFSLGLERILVILEQIDQLAAINIAPDLIVTHLDPNFTNTIVSFANQARQAGLKTEIYPETSKLKKQLKYCAAQKTRFVAIIGSREIENGVITIKDLTQRAQHSFSAEEAIIWMQEHKLSS